MIQLSQIVDQAKTLAPFPLAISKLAALVAKSDSTLDELTDIIQYDQILSSETLLYANSAMSASRREVVSVKDAIIRIGAARLLEWLISRYIRKEMIKPIEFYGYSEHELWFHSIASAATAEVIGPFVTVHISGIAFTAALLHDIGKLLMVKIASISDIANASKSLILSSTDNSEFVERKLFGYSHAELGAILAETWELPPEIICAIRDHHTVTIAADPTVDCVRIANLVAKIMGIGLGNEGMAFTVDSGAAVRLGLTKTSFEKLCATASKRLDEVLSMYDMDNSRL